MHALTPLWPLALAITTAALGGAPPTTQPSPDGRCEIGDVLHADDFQSDSGQWVSELEKGGGVTFGGGQLDIDVPGGATVWFKPMLAGPVLIQYEATVIKAGGPNDRVSDLNCFWMARDSRNPADLFAVKRSGKFADYNPLLTYYVGLGGNGNTTTRFRRYIGDPVVRPLLPEHDLRDKADMISPNVSQLIQLIANGNSIEYFRDGHRLFNYDDAHAYTSGWFAFRATQNHMQIRHFRVFALRPSSPTTRPAAGEP
jgi:Domain of unknown function (DUF6250)